MLPQLLISPTLLLCFCALMLLCFCAHQTLSGPKNCPTRQSLFRLKQSCWWIFDDFDRLRTQFEETNFYKLFKDPAMAAFVDDFKTKWREKIRKPDNELLRVIADIDALPRGRVAAAFVLNEQINKDANEPPLLLITQWGQTIAKSKKRWTRRSKRPSKTAPTGRAKTTAASVSQP